jgi:hypothetical protein
MKMIELNITQRARRGWVIDDRSTRRAVDAVVFTFAVTVLLRGFEADPRFAALMAVGLGLYARFVLGILAEEGFGTAPGPASSETFGSQ